MGLKFLGSSKGSNVSSVYDGLRPVNLFSPIKLPRFFCGGAFLFDNFVICRCLINRYGLFENR